MFNKTETTEVLRLPAEDTQTSKNLEVTRLEKKGLNNPLNNASSGTDQHTSATANADVEQNYQFPIIVVQSAQETPGTSSSKTESKEAWRPSTGKIDKENSLDGAFHKPSSSESIVPDSGSYAQGLIGEKINTDNGVKREEYSSAKSHSTNSLDHEGAMPQKSDVFRLISDGEMQNKKGKGKRLVPHAKR